MLQSKVLSADSGRCTETEILVDYSEVVGGKTDAQNV